jgi:hypothetical protein
MENDYQQDDMADETEIDEFDELDEEEQDNNPYYMDVF